MLNFHIKDILCIWMMRYNIFIAPRFRSQHCVGHAKQERHSKKKIKKNVYKKQFELYLNSAENTSTHKEDARACILFLFCVRVYMHAKSRTHYMGCFWACMCICVGEHSASLGEECCASLFFCTKMTSNRSKTPRARAARSMQA